MRLVTISGCSGGGKSTLLAELARRGHAVVEEPGRRVIADGGPSPWEDMAGFLRRVLAMAIADRAAALAMPPPVFLDRGVVDAAVALEALTGEPARDVVPPPAPPDAHVFLAPPWPAIYVRDAARRHGRDEALAEYRRLARAYPALGFVVHELPRAPVAARADLVTAVVAPRMR